jgi:uncharacterized NAD(P)/FAD-binding protein YdhS
LNIDAGASPMKTVAVVGGGLSGALFALKLARARPEFRVVVVESRARLGRGVAYGACAPGDLLNVPVSRMEVGLQPTFGGWLGANPAAKPALASALKESGGDIRAAFAPRRLFGDYLQEQVAGVLITGPGPGLASVRGEVVRLLPEPKRGVLLSDGRAIEADMVVLATGNLAPQPPECPDAWLYDSGFFVPDPWSADAFEALSPGDPALLVGAGLTMVDIALKLAAAGGGPMLAISRRGLAPQVHVAGGSWAPFLEDALPASPRQLARLVRAQVEAAQTRGVPWQRVFDAARPAVPAVWRGWTTAQKRQFLRHLRTRWDVHRHRMAPRIGAALDALIAGGRLEISAARVRSYRWTTEGGADRVDVTLATRGGGERRFSAAAVINCTGPRRDLDRLATPLLADLRERGLATPDALGLGLETENSALLDGVRRPSDWLFALGTLTCPSWWEITAVPEINVQIDNLVGELAQADAPRPSHRLLSPEDFLDLGAGI